MNENGIIINKNVLSSTHFPLLRALQLQLKSGF